MHSQTYYKYTHFVSGSKAFQPKLPKEYTHIKKTHAIKNSVQIVYFSYQSKLSKQKHQYDNSCENYVSTLPSLQLVAEIFNYNVHTNHDQ
jgi:hypothetical protein